MVMRPGKNTIIDAIHTDRAPGFKVVSDRIIKVRQHDRVVQYEKILAIGFATLIVFPLLYLFRSFDNNTLTSWQWTVPRQDLPLFMSALIMIVISAYFAAIFCRLEDMKDHLLGLTACLAAIPFWFAPEMLLDSGRYFMQSQYLVENGILSFLSGWGRDIWSWTDLPASPFLYGIIRRFFGESRLGPQIFNTLVLGGTVLLTRAIGGRLWNRRVGCMAGLLILGSPFLLALVPQYLNDLHVMFFLTLYLFCLLQVSDTGKTGWMAAAVGAALFLFLSKFSAWPVLMLLPFVVGLVDLGDKNGKTLKLVIVAGAGALLMALVFFAKHDVFISQLRLLSSFQAEGLKSWQESYGSTLFFQIHPFLTIAAGAGLVRAWRLRDRKMMMLAWFPLLAVTLGMERSRYLLPFFPLLALMAAYGLETFSDIYVRRYLAIIMILFSLLIGYGAYLPFFRSSSMMNLKLAGEFLDTLPAVEMRVVALPQSRSTGRTEAAIPILDIYTAKQLLYMPGTSQPEELPDSYTDSLQFSRSMPLTHYYRSGQPSAEQPRIIISDMAPDLPQLSICCGMPSGRVEKTFSRHTEVYKYQTLVTVITY